MNIFGIMMIAKKGRELDPAQRMAQGSCDHAD